MVWPMLCFGSQRQDCVKRKQPLCPSVISAAAVAPSPTAAPCASRDLSRWDKLFIMLEDSHMRQNMLLQQVDDMVRVQLRSLRDEMRHLVSSSESSSKACCTRALEEGITCCTALSKRMSQGFEQTQRQLREAEERCQMQNNTTLQLLRDIQRTQAACLSKLESGYGRGTALQVPIKTVVPTRIKEQHATPAGGTKMEITLLAIASDLQRVQAQLAALQRSLVSH
ncbi:pentraxin-related protein PTX3 [Engraulis encrasicolus]|uniref:pentraxin-related protein PTX3 n=1 Tax=Engraulis encrasicolus TaxID=184585 RepID=UPI002FD78AF7